jgi:hypothetical protein
MSNPVYQELRDMYEYCQNPDCGSTSYLEIHHIIFRSQGGKDELDNLVLLCKECHMRAHGHIVGGMVPIHVGYEAGADTPLRVYCYDQETQTYPTRGSTIIELTSHTPTETDGTDAYNLNEEVKALARVFHSSGLELGAKLHKIYTEKIYEALDYGSFNEYVAGELPIGKAQAYRVKGIAAQSERLELPEGILDGIAIDKLSLVLPLATEDTVNDLLDQAKHNSYSDLKAEVRGEPEHNFTAENTCLKCDKSCCQQHRNYGG